MDLFLVPLTDGDSTVGQVVGHEPQALDSVVVALFDKKVREPPVALTGLGSPISVVFATRDLLDSGRWEVFGNGDVQIATALLPLEDARAREFVGVKIVGSGIIEKFLNAFLGLAPWDAMKDPEYLDRPLVSSDAKPTGRLVYKNK